MKLEVFYWACVPSAELLVINYTCKHWCEADHDKLSNIVYWHITIAVNQIIHWI